MSEMPPPPLGPSWTAWGERVAAYLARVRDKLTTRTGDERAADDGLLLWDRDSAHAVISDSGEWRPLSFGGNYGGAFYSTAQQSAAVVNTATSITWNSTSYTNRISIDSSYTSRINVLEAGKYIFSFSAQAHSGSAAQKTLWCWPRINGTDQAGYTVRSSLESNNNREAISRSGIFTFSANDYLEFMFAVDDLNVDLQGAAAESFCPAVPSVTLSLVQIA